MHNKKFLKKLAATALALGLGTSSMISASAMSPKSLWEKINQYKDKNALMQDFNKTIKPELIENGFDDGEIAKANEKLNKGTDIFKQYVSEKLEYANNNAIDLRSKILERVALIAEKSTLTCFKGLKDYFDDQTVKNNAQRIESLVKECKDLSDKIAKDDDISVHALEKYKSQINEKFNQMKQILSTALQKIEQLENEKFAQPNPGSEETKTNLQNRFKNLRAGNQIISGPCSLYAATTAINEFKSRTNPGQIIQRLPDDNRIYSAVENEYINHGFKNPFGLNQNGQNGKTMDDMLAYIHASGIEARYVFLCDDENFGFVEGKFMNFMHNVLRTHFQNQTSPILVFRNVGGFGHAEAIAGIVGNEFLAVNSAGDSLNWRTLNRLWEYIEYGAFSAIFLGNAKTEKSIDDGLYMAAIQKKNDFEKAKANLLRFASGDFNIKSLIEG